MKYELNQKINFTVFGEILQVKVVERFEASELTKQPSYTLKFPDGSTKRFRESEIW